MKIIKADLWSVKSDITVVTTNSTLDSHGRLVMGAGTALQARQRYPGIATIAGTEIETRKLALGRYGFLLIPLSQKIGLLQTKVDWRRPTPIDLLQQSLFTFRYYLNYIDPASTVAMPIPGVGRGGLNRDVVMPILESELGDFGDRVTVCDP